MTRHGWVGHLGCCKSETWHCPLCFLLLQKAIPLFLGAYRHPPAIQVSSTSSDGNEGREILRGALHRALTQKLRVTDGLQGWDRYTFPWGLKVKSSDELVFLMPS